MGIGKWIAGFDIERLTLLTLTVMIDACDSDIRQQADSRNLANGTDARFAARQHYEAQTGDDR